MNTYDFSEMKKVISKFSGFEAGHSAITKLYPSGVLRVSKKGTPQVGIQLPGFSGGLKLLSAGLASHGFEFTG